MVIIHLFNVIFFAIALIVSSIAMVDLFVYSFNKQFYDLTETKEKLSIGFLYKEFAIASLMWILFYMTCLI